MQHTTSTDFIESLSHLRQALVDADPLTLVEAEPVERHAGQVETLFAGATDDERPRLLLRALDDAIASLEIAGQLADELHARRHDLGAESDPAEPRDGERNRLLAAYLAFTESQTQYQALYQYRNVLAAQLREQTRAVPERVGAPDAAPANDEPAPEAKTRRRGKKSI